MGYDLSSNKISFLLVPNLFQVYLIRLFIVGTSLIAQIEKYQGCNVQTEFGFFLPFFAWKSVLRLGTVRVVLCIGQRLGPIDAKVCQGDGRSGVHNVCGGTFDDFLRERLQPRPDDVLLMSRNTLRDLSLGGPLLRPPFAHGDVDVGTSWSLKD